MSFPLSDPRAWRYLRDDAKRLYESPEFKAIADKIWRAVEADRAAKAELDARRDAAVRVFDAVAKERP